VSQSCSAINRVDDRDVPRALFAIGLGLAIFSDAIRIQLQGELVNGFELALKPLSRDLASDAPLFFEGERRRK